MSAAQITTTQPSQTRGASSLPRYPALDGLRGMAILVVILFHCFLSTRTTGQRRIDPMIESMLGTFAPTAMDLFFVISGFLITSILDRTREAEQSLRTFYFRRILRIVPLYYGFLLIVLLFLQFLPDIIVGTRHAMFWEFAFLTNIPVGLYGNTHVGRFYPHFWTLAIEEQFYILWPLIILTRPWKSGLRISLIVIVLSVICRFALGFMTATNAGFFLTPSRLDGLAAGAALALGLRNCPDVVKRWVRPIVIASVALAVASLFLFSLMQSRGMQALIPPVWNGIVPFLATVFFTAWIARLTTTREHRPPAWLVSPVLTSVARYSYGMYAVHVPIITLLFYYKLVVQRSPVNSYDFPYRIYFFILVAGLSYGVGLISWHLYEKQFLKLAPRYRYSRQTGEAVVVRPGMLPVP